MQRANNQQRNRVKINPLCFQFQEMLMKGNLAFCQSILSRLNAGEVRRKVPVMNAELHDLLGGSASLVSIAIATGTSVELVNNIIDKIGPDIRTNDDTPLMLLACKQAHLKLPNKTDSDAYQAVVIKLILSMYRFAESKSDKEDILRTIANIRDSDEFGGCTILHQSAQYGFEKIVNVLLGVLGSYVNINAKAEKNVTPIMLAAKNNHANIVGRLLEHKDKPDLLAMVDLDNAANPNEIVRVNILEIAFDHNALDCLRILLPHIIKKPADYAKAKLLHLFEKNYLHPSNKLTKKVPLIQEATSLVINYLSNYDIQCLIRDIFSLDDPDYLEPLLNKFSTLEIKIETKINNTDETVFLDLLYMAAMEGAVKCLEKLIALSIFDLNKRRAIGLTPLGVATTNHHIHAVKCLLSSPSVDPNASCLALNGVDEVTPLFFALNAPNATDYVLLFLKYNADPNLANITYNMSPIYFISAGLLGAGTAGLFLSDSRIIVDIRAKDGNRPIDVALYLGEIDSAKFLLDKGASPNFIPGDMVSPIFYAVHSGYIESVRLVLSHPNYQCDLIDNETPHSLIAQCIISEFHDIANELLEANLSLLKSQYNGVSILLYMACGGFYKFMNAISLHLKKAVEEQIILTGDLNNCAILCYLNNDINTARALYDIGVAPDLLLPNTDKKFSDWIVSAEEYKNIVSDKEIMTTSIKDDNVIQPFVDEVEDFRFSESPSSYDPGFFYTSKHDASTSISSKENHKSQSMMPICSHQYLQDTLHLNDDTIRVLQKSRKSNSTHIKTKRFQLIPPTMSKPVTSWCNGAISASFDKIRPIQRGINSFIWIPEDYLARHGCNEDILSRFIKVQPIMNDDAIKKIKHVSLQVNLHVDNIKYATKITHELRLANCKNRLFLAPIREDDATLYIAVIYKSSGLHQTSDVNSLTLTLKNTPIIIDTKELMHPASLDIPMDKSSVRAAIAARI